MSRPAITLVQYDDGLYEIKNLPAISPGIVGLYLAEIVAKYCAANPSTQAERIAYEQAQRAFEAEGGTA